MKIKLFATLSAILTFLTIYAGDIDNSYYDVDISITPAEKVDKIELKACPVYDNKKYAFTMRWDDNNQANFRMQELMHKYGFKGTFYLNAQKKYDYKRICTKGTDVGSHSMTHPELPFFNSNKIFQETVEIKPFIESRTDKPINTYCFSYGAYHNESAPETGHWIAESLQRAGYHFNTYARFVDKYCKQKEPVSSYREITPGDSNPSLSRFEKILHGKINKPKYKHKDPNIGIGIHVWMKKEKAWQNMESILKKYSGRKDWWYCTQTDYAAYRKLYKLCKITEQKKNANAVEYKVVLPYASDIGSDIPLTMCFNGKVAGIKINGKNVAAKYADGKSYFNISPPAYAGIPAVISYARNRANNNKQPKSSKTQIKPWLSIDRNDKLKLILQAEHPGTIKNIKVKYILPLMYKQIKAENIKVLSVCRKIITKQLKKGSNIKLHNGTPFILCQIDYLADGKPERAYASTFGRKIIGPASDCFRDKSLVSNLFENPDVLKDQFCELSKSGEDKTGLKWFKSTDEARAVLSEDTTVISHRLKGKYRKFSKKSPFIAIRYSFDSKRDTEWNISNRWYLRRVKALFVNGNEIPKEKMHKIKVKKGKNHIIMVNKLRWLYYSMKFRYIIKK